MYITKQKKTHKYREQTKRLPVERGWGEGRDRSMGLRDTNYYV